MHKTLTALLLCSASHAAFAGLHLNAHQEHGHFSHITADASIGLAAVNTAGELWRYQQDSWEKLGEGFAAHSPLAAGHGRIAGVDAQGFFREWRDNTVIQTTLALAPDAGMVQLPLATIAVSHDSGGHYLLRIENGRISAKRSDVPLLPDARPLLADIDGKGRHIAVLAAPSTVYDHAVLGDNIEAQAVHYVERHSLEDLAEPLRVRDPLVFEANALLALPQAAGGKIVTVLAGEGARTVVIGIQNNALHIEWQSAPLPQTHRWLSPLVRQNTLYSVQMPHLKGELLLHHYPQTGAQTLGEGLSNHRIGARDMNLAQSVGGRSYLPRKDYRSLVRLDDTGIHATDDTLPAGIIMSATDGERAWFLLDDGSIYAPE